MGAVLDAREPGGGAQPLAERLPPLCRQPIDRLRPGLARSHPPLQVSQRREPLRLRIDLALRCRPIDGPALPNHPCELMRARASLADEREDDVRDSAELRCDLRIRGITPKGSLLPGADMSTDTTSTEAMVARLEEAIEAWNRGDLDEYLTLYDEDVTLYGYGPAPMNKTEVRGFYEGIFAGLPGSQIELADTFGEGDRIVTRFVQRGSHDGPLMGVPCDRQAGRAERDHDPRLPRRQGDRPLGERRHARDARPGRSRAASRRLTSSEPAPARPSRSASRPGRAAWRPRPRGPSAAPR